MESSDTFDPVSYWSDLIVGSSAADVDEVGISDMGRSFNRIAYSLRLHALNRICGQVDISPPNIKIFEAAFGVGYYLKYWRSRGCRDIVGVDLSPMAKENVQRQFPEFDLRLGNLAEMHHWPDWTKLTNSFDLVTAVDVLYHVIDEDATRQAVDNLSKLVAPDGVFIFTEKFRRHSMPVRETENVLRRPLEWYSAILEENGLVFERMLPVFWCMDPPVFSDGFDLSASLARLLWVAMRLCLKFWPRNSTPQIVLGLLVGTLGKIVDGLVVPRLEQTANLSIVAFRKKR
ncbi:MAG: class I SAM-dependent methyltransferase [Armatimonadota bacterium]|nr:class I SAM-dependent methyltransferase [Armatimonadota bacterium]